MLVRPMRRQLEHNAICARRFELKRKAVRHFEDKWNSDINAHVKDRSPLDSALSSNPS